MWCLAGGYMADEDNEKEDFDDGGVAETRQQLYKWLPFSLLLLFLAGGGYYAFTAMRQAAHTLAGGDNYKQLSANSAVYNGKSTVPRDENFFPSEEPGQDIPAAGGAAGKDKDGTAGDKRLKARQEGPDGSAAGSVVIDGQQQPSAGPNAPSSASLASSLAAKLQAKTSSFSGPGAAASKTSSPAGVEAFQGGGTSSVGKPSTQRETTAGAPRKGGSTGVLDSLKGGFRSSLYGARVASHDSARSWIAKIFDATPDYDTAIQYDETMRSKLDKINPNSIPKFLREQDISASEAKTLAVSEVGKPEIDNGDTKEAQAADTKKKAAADLTSGLLNSLFSGLGSSLGGAGATDPTSRMNTSSPDSDPSLTNVDEFGNTTITGPDGLGRIYSQEGDLLGCEDSTAGMCLMAGAGACI